MITEHYDTKHHQICNLTMGGRINIIETHTFQIEIFNKKL